MSERCSKSAIKFPYTRLGSGLFCNNFVCFVLQRKRMELFSSLQLFHLCVYCIDRLIQYSLIFFIPSTELNECIVILSTIS